MWGVGHPCAVRCGPARLSPPVSPGGRLSPRAGETVGLSPPVSPGGRLARREAPPPRWPLRAPPRATHALRCAPPKVARPFAIFREPFAPFGAGRALRCAPRAEGGWPFGRFLEPFAPFPSWRFAEWSDGRCEAGGLSRFERRCAPKCAALRALRCAPPRGSAEGGLSPPWNAKARAPPGAEVMYFRPAGRALCALRCVPRAEGGCPPPWRADVEGRSVTRVSQGRGCVRIGLRRL